MNEETVVAKKTDLKVVLNGGSDTMDAATIPIQWSFSDKVIAKNPTYIVIVVQNRREADDIDNSQRNGQRYACKISKAVKLIQLFTPGYHRITVLALAGEEAKKNVDRLLEVWASGYQNSVNYNSVEVGEVVLLRFSVVAATTAEFDIPKELFAKKPETNFQKKLWKYVNLFFSKDPKDQCAYRKRKIFAFTLQPPLVLIGLSIKLSGGVAYALYVLIASLVAFFFGYKPMPIISGVKDAFLYKREGGFRKGNVYYDTNKWVVTRYGEYRLWKKSVNKNGFRYDAHDVNMPVTGIELCGVIVLISFIYLLVKTGVLVGLLYTGTVIVAGIILAVVTYYLLDRFVTIPRLFGLIPKRSAAKKELLRLKRLAEEKAKKRQKEKEKKIFEQLYNEWLSKNLNIASAPERVDLKKIPKPIGKGARVVQYFRVNYWTLKIKMCRPFSS